jgi:hypothetical protein
MMRRATPFSAREIAVTRPTGPAPDYAASKSHMHEGEMALAYNEYIRSRCHVIEVAGGWAFRLSCELGDVYCDEGKTGPFIWQPQTSQRIPRVSMALAQAFV